MIARSAVVSGSGSPYSGRLGNVSYFHCKSAIRSSSLSNSAGGRDEQMRASLRAISRRALARASRFLRSCDRRFELDWKTSGPDARFVPHGTVEPWAGKTRATYDSRPCLLVGVALEARILLRPTVGLMARWTLDWVHLLDGRRLERLRIHRISGVNHFSGLRALNDYAVHSFPWKRLSRGRVFLQGGFRAC